MAASPAQPAPPSESTDHVRLNKVRPALYGHDIVLPNEDREIFERAGRNLENRYHPRTFEEIELVQTLHLNWWRLDRAIANEHNLHLLTEQQQLANIDALFGEQDPHIRRALAQSAGLQNNMRLFDQLSRHIARLHRIVDQTRRDLESRIAESEQAAAAEEMVEEMREQSQSAPATLTPMPQFTGSLKDFKRKNWLRQQEKLRNSSAAASRRA